MAQTLLRRPDSTLRLAFSDPRLMVCAALLATLYEALKGYVGNPSHTLLDPDSFMRIVRIRDGLRTGWFTHVVANDNGGHGTIVYWSHLLDGVILALRVPLLLVLGSQPALYWAAAITGPLFAGALAAALAWVPLACVPGPARWRWVWPAPLAIMVLPALPTYGLLGYVHYHLPLVVLALLAAGCAGRAAITGDRATAIWCGLWASLAVWLSPEALPYVLMSIGALALAWCQHPARIGPAWRACGLTFGLGTTLFALIDPPAGGVLAPEIDCISPVFASLAILIGVAAAASRPLARHTNSLLARLAAYLLISVALIGLWLVAFPGVTRGLSGLVPPADVAAYFGAISEMQPVPVSLRGLAMLAIGIAGTASAGFLAWRSNNLLWAYTAGCGAVVILLAIFYVRFLGYAEAAGAAMLPIALVQIGSPDTASAPRAGRRHAILAVFLGPSLLSMLIPPLGLPAKAASAQTGPCRVAEIAPLLARTPGAVVLTEISDTPELLWRTPARTVGSLYHRNIATFVRARAAWRSQTSAGLPEAVRATAATHVLACDSLGRPELVADLPEDTLQDSLTRHDPPAWLTDVGGVGGYRLYRVKQ